MRLPCHVAARGFLALSALFLILLLPGAGYGGEDAGPAKDYDALLKRLKGGDTSIDFAEFRYSHARTKSYEPYAGNDDDRDAMWQALNENRFEAAVKHAGAVLDDNYADMDAHFVSRIGYREIGDAERSEFHKAVLKGLMTSLYESGDGNTPETAFVVISTKEEYSFFGMNRLKVIKQKSMTRDGIHYDEIEVENLKTGEKEILYFNVEIPFRWLTAGLGKKAE